MQIFILGRTLAEQRRFAEMVQNQLGATPETLPLFSATLAAFEGSDSTEGLRLTDLDGIPLSAYIDHCSPAVSDPNEAYRLWRQWFAAENLLVIGADAPDVFISLMAHDDQNAVIYLEEDGCEEMDCPTAAQAAIAAFLGWQETRRAIPSYRLSAVEFEALVNGDDVHEGPSEAFLELWAA
jgi:hypothetical protein